MKYIASLMVLISSFTYACDDSEEFPHRVIGQAGAAFKLGECAPVKLVVPTIHNGSKVSVAFINYISPNTKKPALEARLGFQESPDTENKTEIDLCLNQEVAATVAVEIYYKHINTGAVRMCGPERYRVTNFLHHMGSS